MSLLFWYPGHELLLGDIAHAENCYLFDSKGNRYVDFESGVWCTSIGHGHPRVLAVLREQAARITHCGFNYTNEVVEGSARTLLGLVGFDRGRAVFLCSGSEAIEYGVRVARMVTDRPLFLTMADSYFGAYGSAATRRAEEWLAFDWVDCSRCSKSLDCAEDCPRFASIPFQRIGAFLLEPGSSSGLVRFPPPGLIRRIVARVRSDGGLILVNEVTTGIGRTGEWFGYQHYRLDPDIVAAGKGLGNGYPISVALFARRVVDRLANRPIRYAQSHQNDPLGAAVAATVISVIEEERLVERGRKIGTLLADGLEQIRSGNATIHEVRARGAMIAIEIEDSAGDDLTGRIHRGLVERGYVAGRRPGVNVIRLDPPLTIPEEEIAGFLAAVAETLPPAKGGDPFRGNQRNP